VIGAGVFKNRKKPCDKDWLRRTFKFSSITLSKIFEWYASDFGDIVTFINKYSSVKVNKNAGVVFKEYDWTLNGK
jgi:hypothetical protein